MTPSRPSPLATWLLRRFGCGTNNDAAIGDLAERYSKGKTAAWYWRQVIVTIAVSTFNHIRGRKVLTLRDLAVGWIILWIAGGSVTNVWAVVGALRVFAEWSPASLYPTINAWIPLWTYAEFAELYPYAVGAGLGLLTPLLSGIIGGWIIAKIKHPHDRPLLLLLNITILLLWIIVWISFPFATMAENFPFLPQLLFWMAGLLLMTGVFTGGLLKRNPEPAMK